MNYRDAAICLALAIGLAGCSGASSTRAPKSQPGVAAKNVGGVYLCLPTAPIAAYGALFYPVNYPAPPAPTKRPTRCFASQRQATAAGFHHARPPEGAADIAGVYLVTAEPSLARLCVRSAKTAGIAVPCPTLVPGKADAVFCAGVFPCARRGAFVIEGSFAGPQGYVGASPGNGHLFILGFDKRSGVWPADTLDNGTVVGTTTVRGHPARFVAFPPGSSLNSGHVALIWHVHRTTYAVTLHGHTQLNERLDRVIAQHIRFISA